MDNLLTVAEAAKLLGLKVSTLNNWRSRKKGPQYVVLGARTIRYRHRDLEAFINKKVNGLTR